MVQFSDIFVRNENTARRKDPVIWLIINVSINTFIHWKKKRRKRSGGGGNKK